MKLLFPVDQKEAIKRGIDAPTSTVVLDIDPSTLTQDERDILAAIVVDGHDCTKRGIPLQGQYTEWTNTQPATCAGVWTATLVDPTIEGLRSAIQWLIEYRQTERTAYTHDLHRRIAAIDLDDRSDFAWATWFGNGTMEPTKDKGEIHESVKYHYPADIFLTDSDMRFIDQDHRQMLAEKRDKIASIKQAAMLATKEEAMRLIADRKAEIAAKKAIETAEKEMVERAKKARHAQLDAFVREHMPERIEQWEEGLLCEEHILTEIESSVFAFLEGEFSPYVEIDQLDVDAQKNSDFDIYVRNPKCLDPEEYDTLVRLRNAVHAVYPDAKIEAKENYAEVNGEEVYSRISFMVTIQIGQLTFSREYGM